MEAIAFRLVDSTLAGTVDVKIGATDALAFVDGAGPVFGGRFVYPRGQEPVAEPQEPLIVEVAGADPDVEFTVNVQYRVEP